MPQDGDGRGSSVPRGGWRCPTQRRCHLPVVVCGAVNMSILSLYSNVQHIRNDKKFKELILYLCYDNNCATNENITMFSLVVSLFKKNVCFSR